MLYTNSSDKQLLDAITAVKDPNNFDPHAMFTFGFVYDVAARRFGADIAMYHSRPERVRGSTLEAFANIQPQILNTLRVGPVSSFTRERLSEVIKPY